MKTKKTFTREEHENIAKSLIGKTIELSHKDMGLIDRFEIVSTKVLTRSTKVRGENFSQIWWATTDKWQKVLAGETAKDQGMRINLVNN